MLEWRPCLDNPKEVVRGMPRVNLILSSKDLRRENLILKNSDWTMEMSSLSLKEMMTGKLREK